MTRVIRRVLGAVTHVQTEAPVVALTFDDGPHPDYTPRLLDLFARHGGHATFFVLGQAARQQRDLLARMAAAGHAIGSHTWDHPSFPTIRRRARWAQVRAWDQAVAPYGQRIFRPPYGHQTLATALDLRLMGYQVVTWNVLGRDWLTDDADTLVARIAGQLRPGSIVLLHDALHSAENTRAFDRTPTLDAVAQLLQMYDGRYEFVTVPDLLSRGRPQLSTWDRPPKLAWLNTLNRAEDLSRAPNRQ